MPRKKVAKKRKKTPESVAPDDGSLVLPRATIEKILRRDLENTLFDGVAKVTRVQWRSDGAALVGYREFVGS